MSVVIALTVRVSVLALPRIIFPSTVRLFSNVDADPTVSVPLISVLPFVERTVNLSSVPLVILKFFAVVSRVMLLWNVEFPSTSNSALNVTLLSTSRVLLNVTPLSTSNVPSVCVLPLSVSISNTLVPPAVLISNFLLSACKRRPSVIVVCN